MGKSICVKVFNTALLIMVKNLKHFKRTKIGDRTHQLRLSSQQCACCAAVNKSKVELGKERHL